MKKITVFSGQNLFDIAIQEYGSVEALVKIANDNGLRADDDLTEGQQLIIDDAALVNQQIVNYFKNNGHDLNTGDFVDLVIGENEYFDYDFDFDLA